MLELSYTARGSQILGCYVDSLAFHFSQFSEKRSIRALSSDDVSLNPKSNR